MMSRFVFFSMAVLAVLAMNPTARAELIVYDGFGYPDGEYLQITDGGDNAVDPSVDTGVYDNLDDGIEGPTSIDDPGRQGGTGPWLTSWTKRLRNNPGADFIDGTSTLTYKDSKGNDLATTLGKPVYDGRGKFRSSWRTFDASGIAGGSLTFANDAADYNVPRLGKQDSVVWMSYLADRSVETGGNVAGNWFVGMQFWNKQAATAQGDPFVDRTGGIFRQGDVDYLFWDAANGGDPVGSTGLGDITGSKAADDDETNGDLFIVVKLDYSASINDPFEGLIEDGYADVSVWIDPDLDDVEPTGAPAVTGSGYLAFNGVNFVSSAGTGDLSTSSQDEVRLGTTYADVSPIASAAGLDGDYNDDGVVNAADYTVWLDNLGASAGAFPNDADGGAIGQAQYDTWKANFGNTNGAANGGAVPEPASLLLLGIAGAVCVVRRRR